MARRFHLVKEQQLIIPDSCCSDIRGVRLYVRKVTLPVVMELAGTSGSCASGSGDGEDSLAKLKVLLNNARNGDQRMKNAGQQEGQLDWSLRVSVGTSVDRATSVFRNFVRVTGARKGNLLERLKTILKIRGVDLKMMVEIKDFTCRVARGHTAYVKTNEVTIDEFTANMAGREGARLLFSENFNEEHWQPSFQGKTFTGVITITVILSSSGLEKLLGGPKSINAVTTGNFNRKLLEEGVHSDVTIVACDGDVKCHKAFLAGRSPVFEAMFKEDNFKESKTSTVEMFQMSSEAVKAFLAYLYYEDVHEKAFEDCGIALDLFKAGHKYDVPGLEERMRCLLLSQPDNWFEVDVAMMLYLFARNLVDGEALKKRAVQLLKINAAELNTSASYKELFKKDPEVAMELFQYSLSI